MLQFILSQATISGQVLDEDGEGLIGANVLIAETKIGGITGYDDNFKLSVPAEYTRSYNLILNQFPMAMNGWPSQLLFRNAFSFYGGVKLSLRDLPSKIN